MLKKIMVTSFTGIIPSAMKALQQHVVNKVQHPRYSVQQKQLFHGHGFLTAPALWQHPSLARQTTFTCSTMKNKPYFNLVLNNTRLFATVNQYRWKKVRTKADMPKKHIPKSKRILLGPQRKGVCIKVFSRNPKKPNSGNRKCALLKLSNGKVITAYIPGERAVLQEHAVVLFEGGRVQDCPGIKYKIIRGKYDMN